MMSRAYLSPAGITFGRFNLIQDDSFLDLNDSDTDQEIESISYSEGLVSRAQNGSEEAFALLYREYLDPIYRYIYLRVRQAEQSEDLTQEVFLRAFRNIRSYRYEGKAFISWLFRIAHNLIIDYYRKSNNRYCVPLEETLTAPEDPVATVEQMLGVEAVREAIEELPPRQREIISLRFVSELSVAETAQITGTSEGSVKKLQHEAILKLKRQMEKQASPSRISGLFLDYDGTISPLNVPRPQSRVSPQLAELLNSMRQDIPIGIVTTKDLPFILPRTPFARAWSAIAGLEMKTSSQLLTSQEAKKTLPSLMQALAYSRQNIIEGGFIEEKCDSQGQPVAFCIDWRHAKDQNLAALMVKRILAYCQNLYLKIIEYPGKPYFDVFPCSINKGKALRKLKTTLKISGSILYMGDSITDNKAFKEADISIGVTTGGKPQELECQYWIKFDDVALFLSSLNKNHFTFCPDLPGIKVQS